MIACVGCHVCHVLACGMITCIKHPQATYCTSKVAHVSSKLLFNFRNLLIFTHI